MRLWVLFTLVLFIYGCGDLRTARDVLQTRNREQINQRLVELQPLVGEYDGTLHDVRLDQKVRFRLNIVLSGEPYGSAGIPEEVTSPSLSATALYYYTGAASELYTTIKFTTSDYDTKTGRLSFFNKEEGSSILIQPRTERSENSSSRLIGQWTTGSRGLMGKFDVSKL